MTVFVTTLPAPNQAYGMTVRAGIQRTEFESGRTLQRRKFHHQPGLLSLSWDLTTQEVAWFSDFCTQKAYRWFWLDIPTPRRPELMSPTKIRFISDYSVSKRGFDWFTVSVQAEAEALETDLAPQAAFYTSGGMYT